MLLDGETVYVNPDVLFKTRGVLEGHVELLLPFGQYQVELKLLQKHCDGHTLFVTEAFVDGQVRDSVTNAQLFKANRLLRKS